jgi:hypothetical protein
MSRLQKKNWNPVLIALRPSHISLVAWLLLSPFIYLSIMEDGNYGFFLGLAIGLSLMQAGYAWGQYQAHWWRFFIENRNAIFESPSNNKPTKKNALNYVIAILAAYSYTTVALFIAVILMYAMDAYPATLGMIKFPWDLLIACLGGAMFSMVLTNRLIKWGEKKSKQLTDFSYVFETEPERQSD